jgi:hypothetical protein
MQRGQLGGLNYEIPQNFVGQPQQPISPGGEPEAAASALYAGQHPRLAERGELTGNYYDTYGRLDAYVKSMLKQGIDPTLPDYTQDGGGLPFQMFQRLQAGLVHSANTLGNELKFQELMQPGLAKGEIGLNPGVDQNSMWAQDPNNFHSRGLTDATKNLNQQLGDQWYTAGGAARSNKRIDQYTSSIDELVAAGLMRPEEAAIQKAGITQSTYEDKQFAPPRPSSGDEKKKAHIAFVEDVTNWAKGIWPENTFEYANIKGQDYAVNRKRSGEVLGRHNVQTKQGSKEVPKVLDYLAKNANGEVYAVYTDPNIPWDRLDSQRGDAVVYSLVGNNDKLGGSAAIPEISNALQEFGLLDKSKNLVESKILPQGYQDIQRASSGNLSNETEQRDGLKLLLKEGVGTVWNNAVPVPIPGKKPMKIKPVGDGETYKIENFDDFKDKLPMSSKKKEFTFDELVDVLQKLRYFRSTVGASSPATGSNVAPQTEAKPVDRAAQIKAKYGVR